MEKAEFYDLKEDEPFSCAHFGVCVLKQKAGRVVG